MSEIIWYLSFSDWLISLSRTSSRPIRAVATSANVTVAFPSDKSGRLCNCSLVACVPSRPDQSAVDRCPLQPPAEA